MQIISNEVIGTMLHQIWHGNPASAPPIHIWTKERPEGCLFLEMNTFLEHVEQGKTLPSAVIILAFNVQVGGGPYLLYWVEDLSNVDLLEKIKEWRTKLGNREAQEIVTMGIGNCS